MVSISDFESDNPGSNPGETSDRVAQWIAHQTSNLRVVGSSPTVGILVRLPESGQRGTT